MSRDLIYLDDSVTAEVVRLRVDWHDHSPVAIGGRNNGKLPVWSAAVGPVVCSEGLQLQSLKRTTLENWTWLMKSG